MTNVTTIEYSLMSANVYSNSNLVRLEQNALPVPTGWSRPMGTNGEADYKVNDSAGSGFMASVFTNGTDVVISFCGTTPENPSDWLNGNLPAGSGVIAPQVLQAAELVIRVINDPQFAGKTLSLTGHSLGGGLASLMAVYFDIPATVFDQAPFLKSADSSIVVDWLRGELVKSGVTVPDALTGYQTDRSPASYLTNTWDPSPTRLAREAEVHPIAIKGEVLSLLGPETLAKLGSYGAAVAPLLFPFVGIAGATAAMPAAFWLGNGIAKINDAATQLLDIGARSHLDWGWNLESSGIAGHPVDLHSIGLLTAILLEPTLEQRIREHPELLAEIFEGRYANNPLDRDQVPLLDLLVQAQYRGQEALSTLSNDASKVDRQSGLTAQEYVHDVQEPDGTRVPRRLVNVSGAIADAVLAGLYAQSQSGGSTPVQSVLQAVGNAIIVDTALLGDEYTKGIAGLTTLLRYLTEAETIDSVTVEKGWRWALQSGSTAMDYVAANDGKSDVVLGYTGDDKVSTGDGQDRVVTGAGNDTIDGGAGNDILQGGFGTDTYAFSGDFGQDIVDDKDGKGEISVEGFGTLSGVGAKKLANGTWQTDDRSIRYTLVSIDASHNDLVITFSGRADTITVKNWSEARSLGITLGSEQAVATTTRTFVGDFARAIDPEHPDRFLIGSDGNYISAADQPDSPDLLTGSADADHMYGLGGDDAILGRGGNDSIEGGAGGDILMGGLGADTLVGGDGNDYILGSSNGELYYPVEVDYQSPTAFLPRVNGQGLTWVRQADGPDGDGIYVGILTDTVSRDAQPDDAGNVIDAGSGDDLVLAGTGDDVVHGGDGTDDIYGMAGKDVLFGGAGGDRIYGDGQASDSALVTQTLGEKHADDVISGGEGNDTLLGQGGDDQVFGGSDDDKIWGDDRDSASTPVEYHGTDYLDGGDGNDTVVGGGGDDTLLGSDGSDVLLGDDDSFNSEYSGEDYLDGGNGADTLVGGGKSDILFGDSGNDILIGDGEGVTSLDQGNDYLDGEDGDDQLFGNGGNDYLVGGAGNDGLLGGDGNDTLEGGDGNDTLSGDGGDDTYVVDLSLGSTTLILDSVGDNTIQLLGVGINDVLVEKVPFKAGTGGQPDVAAHMVIRAGTSTLIVQGDVDGDFNHAFRFDDGSTLGAPALLSAAASAHVAGGSDADVLLGGAQGVLVTAAEGDDFVDAGGGNDTISGGAGADVLYGNDGDDVIDAGSGEDMVLGGNGGDLLLGGAGADTLLGGSGADSIFGGAGDDTYLFGAGDGEDLILDVGGGDRIRFGEGLSLSQLRIATSEGSRDLRLAFDSGEVLTIRSGLDGLIERYEFADGTALSYEVLMRSIASGGLLSTIGGDNSDQLVGTAGNDRLQGFGGHDTLKGGAGNDLLEGANGQDTYYFEVGDGTDTIVDLEGLASRLYFGPGVSPASVTAALEVDGGGAQYLVIGYGPGDDRVRIEGGADAPIDSIIFTNGSWLNFQDWLLQNLVNAPATGTSGNDKIFGLTGNDTLQGLGGNDRIQAREGDDVLLGGAGDDVLIGDHGNDLLDGGADADVLQGGDGVDTYVLSIGGGNDVAVDADGIVRLGAGLTLDDLILQRSGQDLVIAQTVSSDASLLLRGFFDNQGSQWLLELPDGTSTIDVYGLYRDQLVARSQQSPQSQAALTAADFRRWLTRDIFAAAFPEGTYAQLGPGRFQGDGLNYLNSWNDGDRQTTKLNISEFNVTSDAAQIVPPLHAVGIEVDLSPTGTTKIRVRQETVQTSIAPEPIRFIKLEQFILEFGNGPFDPQEYVATYTTDATGERVLAGYTQMSSGSTQQYVRTIEEQVPEILGTTTINESILRVWGQAGDNIIDLHENAAYGRHLIVDAGAGNDFVNVGWHSDNEELYQNPVTRTGPWGGGAYSGYTQESYARAGSFLDGNTGNDTLMGGDWQDVLIGGDGDDVLDGRGSADQYVYVTGSSGWDTVFDSSAMRLTWTYSFGEDDFALERLGVPKSADGHLYVNRELLAYFEHNPSEASPGVPFDHFPATSDYEETQFIFDEGQLPEDTVAFGAGIAVDDLNLSIGAVTIDGVVRQALEISWAVDAGVRIVLPDPDDPYGLGIERFTFADGTSLTMADMLAMTPGYVPPQAAPIDLWLWGWERDDSLSGAEGNDTIVARWGDDTLEGFAGNDLLDGGIDNDSLFGGEGRDTLIGGAGDDLLSGGEGDDRYEFLFAYGTDRVEDLLGHSRLVFDSWSEDAMAYLVDGSDLFLTVGDGGVIIGDWNTAEGHNLSVQFVDGTVWGDDELVARLLTGMPIVGAEGDDELIGTSDDDVVDGAGGNDYIHGLEGNDYLIAGHSDSLATWNELHGDAGDDTLVGGAGQDDLYGGEGNDTYVIASGWGADWIYDAKGENFIVLHDVGPSDLVVTRDDYSLVLLANGGQSTLYVEGWYGQEFGEEDARGFTFQFDDGTTWSAAQIEAQLDLLHMTHGTDVLFGSDAADVIDALAGDDEVFGRGGNDVLDGGGGDDRLLGGSGTNILRGGSGADWLGDNYSSSLLDGEEGDDFIYMEGINFIAGGEGDDTLYNATGDRPGIVAFNLGDGHDSFEIDPYGLSPSDLGTISLGGGIPLASILLSSDPTDGSLTIHIGANDSIKLLGWSSVSANGPVDLTLQLIETSEVRCFDLGAVLAEFSALTLPSNSAWSAQSSLEAHLRSSGSDAAIGGSIAYEYAMARTTRGLGAGEIQAVLSDAAFGVAAQMTGANPGIEVAGGSDADELSGVDGDDIASFGTAIAPDQPWFSQQGSDLQIRVIGAQDGLGIASRYDDSAYQLDEFHADGQVLIASQVQVLVSAMAAFSAPAAGETTLSPAYQQQLGTLFAASWQ